MGFRSLLVPVDLSPLADRVLGRAALLPLSARARITLVHVVPSLLPLAAERRAIRDAKDALASQREQLLGRVPDSPTVTCIVKVGPAPVAIAAVASTAKAELIVMGRGSPRGLRDALLGSTAERVIRKARVPVLAVRAAARAPYRSPLAALEVDESALDVISFLQRLLPPPRPVVSIVHAYDIPFRQMRYPHVTDEDYAEMRDYYRQQALDELSTLVRGAIPKAESSRWPIHATFGNPRAVIPKAAKHGHADLLALATHCYRGAAHALLGTVAGDVLRHVACDVLVVPPTE